MSILRTSQFASDLPDEFCQSIREGSRRITRQLITDAPFAEDTDPDHPLRKTHYLFGDSVTDPDVIKLVDERWLHSDGITCLYLPPFPRHRSLTELRGQAVTRQMPWTLTEEHTSIPCGYTTSHSLPGSRGRRHITGLHPGVMGLEDPPKGEVPIIARTVRNRLAELGRELPIDQYRCFGWSHSSDKAWWGRMTAYVLQRWGAELKSIRLYEAIRATQYGLPVHVLHFLGLMELYNPDTNTFVTRNGELGLPFHEMHKVSGLQLGDIPYQEYFPSNQELQKLKTHKPARYDTLWELTCHYQIALAGANPVARKKSPQISLKQFSCYLFKNLERTGEAIRELGPLARSEIDRLIKKCDARSYTIASAQDRFCAGTKFRTFLLQAEKSIHPKTLLAGYIALWLKKCVVPYQTSDALPIEVLFPAVQLAHGRSLSLLPAMIAGIHRGLRQLTTTFTQTEEIPSAKIPMPKTEFPYTYLMGWLVLHRPDLMSPPKSADLSTPLLQLYEECKWPTRTFSDIRKSLHMHKGWVINPCLPRFPGRYSGMLADVEAPGTDRTSLDVGCFRWLMNIRPGHLLFRVKERCYLEPYLPCRFARQFGYDQLYVGNPNPKFHTRGGLVDGARAWLWNATGCTGAKFCLPNTDRHLELTYLCCKWIMAANDPVPLRSIEDLKAEVVSRIAARIVREDVLERRKREKKPAGPSSKGKQKIREIEEESFASEEETSEEDEFAADAAMEVNSGFEEDAAGLSESFCKELWDLSIADRARRLKARKKWRILPTYNRMIVELSNVDSEEEEGGGLISRARSRAIAQAGSQVEPPAISIQDKPVALQETRPTKRLKLTIKRHPKLQTSQMEAIGDASVGGEGNVSVILIFTKSQT